MMILSQAFLAEVLVLLVFSEVVGKARQICCGSGRKPDPGARLKGASGCQRRDRHVKFTANLQVPWKEIETRCYED